MADDEQVVGDEQQREAGRCLQLAQELQVARLGGDVERRGRLVGDQQPRLAGEGDGAGDALAHAAAELVRILVEPLRGGRQVDLLERPTTRCSSSPPRSSRCCRSGSAAGCRW